MRQYRADRIRKSGRSVRHRRPPATPAPGLRSSPPLPPPLLL